MRTNRVARVLIALLTMGALVVIGVPGLVLANNLKKSDSTVKIFVEYKLTKAGILTNNNVKVDVANRTITLTGVVPTLHDRMVAVKDAKSIDKTYDVVNELTVSAPYLPDSVLAAAVLHRIETHVFYTTFDWLTVGVNNGVVTLHGWVSEPWEAHQYEAEASKIPGVRQIINKLRVEMTSGYLRYRVARLIYDDPLFWQYDTELNPPVHVVVNNGTVILEGYVNSASERGFLASQVTFRTDAIQVVNHLQVTSD